MNTRERNLWLIVGTSILIAVTYTLFTNWNNNRPEDQSFTGGLSIMNLPEAYRLIGEEQDILRRQRAVSRLREQVETEFLAVRNPVASQLALLTMLENIAGTTRMQVDLKNIIALKNNFIAVSMEGKTGPESLIRFMQAVAAAKINLEIRHLQIHAVTEQRLLNYQIIVATQLISKKGA